MARVSVLICTYRAPGELELVLAGLSRQSRPPEEVFVGEDDVAPETARVVARWRDRLPLVHLTQEHHGFRKGRILNEAVARSRGEQLLFLDGDAVPHRHWVRDHVRAYDGERVLVGRRVHLGPELTARVTPGWVLAGRLESLVGPVALAALRGDVHRFRLGVRLPQPLARCLYLRRRRRLMGVNFSLPRSLFETVNGFDEGAAGARREDRLLELRLLRVGARFYPLLNRAVVYHLYHPENGYDEHTRRYVAAQERSSSTRCERGLDAHVRREPLRL